MTPVPIQAVLSRYGGAGDGGMRLTFETGELHADDLTHIHKSYKKPGYLYFQETAFSEIFVPDVKVDIGTKSKSQELRAVIYRLWEKSGKSKDSEAYYKFTMEKIIDQLKEKLN